MFIACDSFWLRVAPVTVVSVASLSQDGRVGEAVKDEVQDWCKGEKNRGSFLSTLGFLAKGKGKEFCVFSNDVTASWLWPSTRTAEILQRCRWPRSDGEEMSNERSSQREC